MRARQIRTIFLTVMQIMHVIVSRYLNQSATEDKFTVIKQNKSEADINTTPKSNTKQTTKSLPLSPSQCLALL
jgi:hypothetical protein